MTDKYLYSITYSVNNSWDPVHLGVFLCAFELSSEIEHLKFYINDELFDYKGNDYFTLFGLNEQIVYFINYRDIPSDSLIYNEMLIRFISNAKLEFKKI
jgi:hypothetical protein